MARRRKGNGWDEIIRGIGALVLVGVGLILFNSRMGGKPNVPSSGTNFLGSVLAVAIMLATLAVGAAGIFYLWKILAGHLHREKSHARSVSHQAHHEDGESTGFSVSEKLDALDWFQLEKLVGTLFEASGYRTEHRGGANPDGGIDLVVENVEGRVAVQCKHWGKWKCGVSVVRELMGSMLHEGIAQGYLIATEITPDAKELAAQHSIGTIDREELSRWVEDVLATENPDVRNALEKPEKICPKCGSKMIQRTAKRGKNTGATFWGCSRYPSCNQVLRS